MLRKIDTYWGRAEFPIFVNYAFLLVTGLLLVKTKCLNKFLMFLMYATTIADVPSILKLFHSSIQ